MSDITGEIPQLVTGPYLVVWPEFLSEIEFLDKIASWWLPARVRGEALFAALDYLRNTPGSEAKVVGTFRDGLPILAASFPPFLLRFVVQGRYVIVLCHSGNGPGPAKAAWRRRHFSGSRCNVFEHVYAVATAVIPAPQTCAPTEMIPFWKSKMAVFPSMHGNAAILIDQIIIGQREIIRHDVKIGVKKGRGDIACIVALLPTSLAVAMPKAAVSSILIEVGTNGMETDEISLNTMDDAVMLAASENHITWSMVDALHADYGVMLELCGAASSAAAGAAVTHDPVTSAVTSKRGDGKAWSEVNAFHAASELGKRGCARSVFVGSKWNAPVVIGGFGSFTSQVLTGADQAAVTSAFQERTSESGLTFGQGSQADDGNGKPIYPSNGIELQQITFHEIEHAPGLADSVGPTSIMLAELSGSNITLPGSYITSIDMLCGAPSAAVKASVLLARAMASFAVPRSPTPTLITALQAAKGGLAANSLQ